MNIDKILMIVNAINKQSNITPTQISHTQQPILKLSPINYFRQSQIIESTNNFIDITICLGSEKDHQLHVEEQINSTILVFNQDNRLFVSDFNSDILKLGSI
jgi:hypothetical protein